MDTQKMSEAVSFTRLAVTLTFDPSAEETERWLACIGFDAYGAGGTPDEALDEAMNREALGPKPIYPTDEDPDPLPFDDAPIADDVNDDDDDLEDPSVFGWLPVRAGRR